MRRAILVLCAIGLAFATAGPAGAIVNGEPDGNRHPMVGTLYFDFDEDGQLTWADSFCSGSYIGWSKDRTSQVFLTAAHCVWWEPDAISVSFDTNPMDGTGVPSGLIQATSYAWDHRSANGFWAKPYDSALVLLPAGSVTGITPLQLPPLGYLDGRKTDGTLMHGPIELVGYGVAPIWNQPGGVQYDDSVIRRTATAKILGLKRYFIQFEQNVHATQLGGICYGDSGSPNLVPGTRMVVSTTTGVGGAPCNAFAVGYRLDTVAARQFLGTYVTLP